MLPEPTTYLYASPYDGSWPTTTISPDAGETTTTYNQLGWVTRATDQRGVAHTYTYGADKDPAAGQVILDAVSLAGELPGQNVDSSVLSIATGYDDLGRVQTVTSCSNSDGTGPVNEVFDSYGGWGDLAKEWQDHSGAYTTVPGTDPAATPAVQYAYDDGGASPGYPAPYLRLSALIYPNGRQIDYNYGDSTAATDYIMSRLSSLV